MANRNWDNGGKLYSMHVMPILVTSNITIGASGAVASSSATSVVTSVTHVSTGIYRLNLADTYVGVISVNASMQSPVSGLSGIVAIETQNAPSASVATFGSPTLTVKCLNPSGALADPASGSVLSVAAIMQNSSVRSP